MFQKNPTHFFNGERVFLTGVLGAYDKLRRHPVQVGAFKFDHTVVAFHGIVIAFDGNDRMRCHAGFNGNIGKNHQGLIIRRH